MGGYEPTRVAKCSGFFVRVFSRRTFIKQYTDLITVCHNLGQILRIKIFIRSPLRARDIVNQDFQGAKLIVIECTMIAVYPI